MHKTMCSSSAGAIYPRRKRKTPLHRRPSSNLTKPGNMVSAGEITRRSLPGHTVVSLTIKGTSGLRAMRTR